MSPLWRLVNKHGKVMDDLQVDCNDKETAQRFTCENIPGGRDVDLVRPCKKAPRGNPKGLKIGDND